MSHLSSASLWLPLPALPPHPTSELSLREEWEDSSLLLELSCCFVSQLLLANCSALTHGNGNPLQYSCLENPMDRGAWWATVHGSQRVGHNWATLGNSFPGDKFVLLHGHKLEFKILLVWGILKK